MKYTHLKDSLLEMVLDNSTKAIVYIWKFLANWQYTHPNKATASHMIIEILNQTTGNDPTIVDVLDVLEFTLAAIELISHQCFFNSLYAK